MTDLERYRPFLDPPAFARLGGLRLRGYQQDVARAIVDSVLKRRGESFAVLFPRQSGKNELQAQIEALLLLAFSLRGGEIVKISPTWRPQSLNAMRRLERVLEAHPATRGRWEKENGYIFRLNRARIFFLSGAPEANIVGATASLLLEVDEAQDVTQVKYDKEIAPMAASTNATRVFWGTAWTSQTLLAREVRAAQAAEQRDPAGGRRAFVLSADSVSAEVPAYGQFVAAQVARLGRQNPLVRTQFYSEEIDGQAGMFPAERIACMRGNHPARRDPQPGRRYALLIDVGCEAAGVSSASGTEACLTQASLFPGAETFPAGSGLPLHFLAEPESSNKSTAESAGGPTYRHFEQRQEFFTWLMSDVTRAAVRRRAIVDPRVKDSAKLQVTGADLSARDNAALAVAMSTTVSALGDLRDRGIIDDAELLRMAYRFAGEVPDVEALLERGRRVGPRVTPGQPGNADGAVHPPAGSKIIDKDTGEGRGAAAIV